MSLKHLKHRDEAQLLRQAMEQLAQLWRPVSGGRYVIKPNLSSALPASAGATTDPRLVTALVHYLRDHSARVSIVELPPHIRNVERVFTLTGYRALAAEHQVPLIDPEQQRDGFVDTGSLLGPVRLRVARAAMECDGIVNMPKVKSHRRAFFSGAVKNLMGLTDMPTRHYMHVLGIHRGIARLYRSLQHKLAFNVVDAMVGMEGNGPTRGDAVRMDSVVLASDTVACDRFLLDALGVEQRAVRYLNMLEPAAAAAPPDTTLLDRPLRPPRDRTPNATFFKEALITQPVVRKLLQRLDLDRLSRRPPRCVHGALSGDGLALQRCTLCGACSTPPHQGKAR